MQKNGFHILVIPKQAKKAKRIFLSLVTVRLLFIAVLLLIPLLIASFISTMYYQNQVVSLKRQIKDDERIVTEKKNIIQKLAQLESSLVGVNSSLKEVEQALDLDISQMTAGLGPIDNETIAVSSVLDEIEEQGLPSFAEIRESIGEVDGKIIGAQSTVEEIYTHNQDRIRLFNALPDVMPVDGWVTSDFGFRRSPHSGKYKMHYGLDIAAPIGSSILAPAGGKVIVARYHGGYGRKIVLDHGYGVTTVFAHASKILVKEGQSVKKGDKIAKVGSTGASTGPHLHYEVHVDGVPTDPLNYLQKAF